MNSLLGFTEWFRANYFVGYVKLTETIQCEEIPDILRTIQNYEEDLKEDDVKENSIWRKLNNFHVVDNLTVNVKRYMPFGIDSHNKSVR